MNTDGWWYVADSVVHNAVVIPVLLEELLLYREAIGLPHWPPPLEAGSLVGRVTGIQVVGALPPVSSTIHKIVKKVFRRTQGTALHSANPGLAQRLVRASGR